MVQEPSYPSGNRKRLQSIERSSDRKVGSGQPDMWMSSNDDVATDMTKDRTNSADTPIIGQPIAN